MTTMAGVREELARKAFHMLSLGYLAFYGLAGYPGVIIPMMTWTIVVVAMETARLRLPRLNALIATVFGGVTRPEEHQRYSGIVHTTGAAFLVFLFFGDRPTIVAAAICFLAFGDAAAALVGKSFGRHKIGSSRKSVEGSAACLVACLIVGWTLGIPALAAVLAASTATLIEFLPTTAWRNDNFWIPVSTAVVLRLCGVA